MTWLGESLTKCNKLGIYAPVFQSIVPNLKRVASSIITVAFEGRKTLCL